MSQAASRVNLLPEFSDQSNHAVGGVRSRSKQDELLDIYQPVASALQAVERILQTELRSDTPWVGRLLEDNWIGGGKRIRPVFLLLSAASCGAIERSHLQMAAAVEMVHCATLVHDDVLDAADTRRHLPTVNSTWDNRTSVLLGDFLFTHAFYVASLSGSAEAIKLMARSSNRVCEGEIRQNAWQGNFDLTESDYLEMVADKTAELCGCSCQIGALLSGASQETASQYENYGLKLGVAFQIIDDVLDLIGQPESVGKTLGTDLLNQKPTLPLIHCLRNSESSERERLIQILQTSTATVEMVLPFLNETGSLQYTREIAQSHASEALQFAESLSISAYTKSLQKLARFVLERTH